MKTYRIVLNEEKIYVLFSAILILFTSWTIYYHLPFGFFFNIIFTLWTFKKYNPIPIEKIRLFIGFFIIAMWFYTPYNTDITFFLGIISAITLGAISIIDERTLGRILDSMFTIIAGIVAIGLFFHLLQFLNIYDSPKIATVKSSTDREYAVFFLYVYERLPTGLFVNFRFYSIFDEPGYLGTITVFYLIYQDFDFKKPRNIVLFIGGMFTLSLAFYILAFPYLLLKLITKPRLSNILLFLLLIIVGLLITQVSALLDLFLMRQEFSGGGFSSSRGDMYIIMKNINFLKNQNLYNLLFGNGYDSYLYLYHGDNNQGVANSNIFRLFYQIGIMGIIYLIVFIIYNAKKDKRGIYFIFAFIFSLYQRPQIFEPIFILLLMANLKPVSDNPDRLHSEKINEMLIEHS